MSIIISESGKPAKRLEREVIQDEAYLQKYIADNPDTLPLQDFKEDIRLTVLAREFPTSSGPIDALAVDGDGDIYLIETKLYKNPDKRLVLAQVLDYGAAIWSGYEQPDDFVTRLDQLLVGRGQAGLAARLQEAYSLEGAALAEYMDQLKAAVSDGRFKFVVLMDRLDERLRDLISFINSNSQFQFLGIGVDFYRHDSVDIIIPTLYGAETIRKSPSVQSGSRRRWDKDRFFGDLEQRVDSAQLAAIRRLFEWTTGVADVSWGTGARHGSFSAKFSDVSQKSVFSVYSNGELSLNFKWLKSTPAMARWSALFGEALKADGIADLPADFMHKFVSLPASAWTDKVEKLIATLEAHSRVANGPSSPTIG